VPEVMGAAEIQPVLTPHDCARSSKAFVTHEDYEAYLTPVRARPDYGGFWDDFVGWASDVWQGIKRGVVEIAQVIVHQVTSFLVKIGEVFVELGGFVIDCVEKASRAARSSTSTTSVTARWPSKGSRPGSAAP
jgi:hypothetical protein